MSAFVFFDPANVERLAACGIPSRGRALRREHARAQGNRALGLPAPRGFVLKRSASPRAVPTHVIDVRGSVTITGSRMQLSGPSPTPATMPAAFGPSEDQRQLRAENEQLRRDNLRLEAEIQRLTATPPRALAQGLDDTLARFALLELD